MTEQYISPFLRWAGGKTWLTKRIDKFLPEEINNYYEPFLGGAAIFFYLKGNNLIKGKSYLSDSNKELINVYKIIKTKPIELCDLLKSHKNTEREYYQMRNAIFHTDVERAAKFLFLNKTSFNGIYRVNKLGVYNVPYGYKKINQLYDIEKFYQISESLKNCFFSVKDFKQALKKVSQQDLVFMDPPYTVAHENNGFIQYNQSLFSWENQIELSKILKGIEKQKANFIMTNASHSSIEKLYNQYGKKTALIRASTIGGTGATRTKYKELIYTNI